MDDALIRNWWSSILSMEKKALEENATSLCNMHNSEQILDLQPLPDLNLPELRPNDLFSRKPAFKHLVKSGYSLLTHMYINRREYPRTYNLGRISSAVS